jgi:uncharacterized membrane protein
MTAFLALVGLAFASYLAYLDYSKANALFCSAGSGCDSVRQSDYVNLMGIPVALWGIIGYVAILAVSVSPLAERVKSLALFSLALSGFAFSVYLIYLELFVIHAICPYCIGSALVMTILLVLLVSRQPIVPSFSGQRLGLLSTGLVAAVLLGAAFLPRDLVSESVTDKEFQVGLARYLTDTGAVMYGSPTCHYCIQQKELFGDAWQYVTEVDCSVQPQQCIAKGIQATPTWEINGEFYLGLTPLEELARLSGYEGPVPKASSSP